MNLLGWVIFGLVAGTIANAIDPQPSSGGAIGAVILGIIGAMVGGFLANLILGLDITGFNLTSLIIAIAGSLLLLFAGRALRGV